MQEVEVFHLASVRSGHVETQVLSTCQAMYNSPAFASANPLNKTISPGPSTQFTGRYKINNNRFKKTSSGLTYQIFIMKALAVLSTDHMFCLTCEKCFCFRRVHPVTENACWLRHICVFPFVPPSAWKNSGHTGLMFIKFDI